MGDPKNKAGILSKVIIEIANHGNLNIDIDSRVGNKGDILHRDSWCKHQCGRSGGGDTTIFNGGVNNADHMPTERPTEVVMDEVTPIELSRQYQPREGMPIESCANEILVPELISCIIPESVPGTRLRQTG